MDPDPLLDSLRSLTGRPDAEFRDGQREAIEVLVHDRSRVLVVQRTGWGKSAVYFLATHLLRSRGAGPTLLISPLLALMRNQIDAATRLGLRCETINSSSATTVADLESILRDDAVDLLLISPERLANPQFASKIMPIIEGQPGLVVIDEVHCISDWGHDFRPDYRRVGRLIDELAGAAVPILGCTATANERVVADVAEQLGAELATIRGPLRRDGLALRTVDLDRQADRLAYLATEIPRLEGSGIVYCLTITDVKRVAGWLTERGISADAYWGGLEDDRRLEAERRLKHNEIKVLVATTALGMGYDKPDLSFVFHYQAPGSPVAYYQQVGRAGRALSESEGVLMRGREDRAIQDHFIESAFADEADVLEVLRVLDDSDTALSTNKLQGLVNLSRSRLDLVLKQLDVDGAVQRVGGATYERSGEPYDYPAQRVAAVTAARRREQQAMADYFETESCRMAFIAGLLDDPSAEACGICDNCRAQRETIDLPSELVAAAEAYLRRQPVGIPPRKQGVPAAERVESGRALALAGDGGWGALIQSGMADGVFDERLVGAAADAIADWAPRPAPTWIASVPSATRPGMIEAFADALGARLGLPHRPVVARIASRPPQTVQENSAHQERNVVGAFGLDGAVPSSPCLLIDDRVDSRWTLTEVGRVLRRAGVEIVHPFALAATNAG